MEQLQVQQLGTVKVDPVEIDLSLDNGCKPGLFQQTKAFLNSNVERLCTLEEQKNHFALYDQIRGQV